MRTKRRAVLTPRDIASDGPEIRFSDERSDYFRHHDLIAVNNTSRTCLYMRSSVPTSIINIVYDARNDLAYAIFATRRKLDWHRAACESCPAIGRSRVWSTELCCFSPQRYALKFRHSPNIVAIGEPAARRSIRLIIRRKSEDCQSNAGAIHQSHVFQSCVSGGCPTQTSQIEWK